MRAKEAKKDGSTTNGFSFRRAFPMFIVFFVLASIITTLCLEMGVPSDIFIPLKELSKFFIIMAMAAIGLNSNFIESGTINFSVQIVTNSGFYSII